ncbi:MAG: hypothetical protein MRJ68_09220 [Nitrospira sp.]|nr:hypothetical protein [Nitrospira sp.]
MARLMDEPVSFRRIEAPVAVHDPRLHAVHGLLGVLLPLVLGHAGQEVLNQNAVRVLSKLNGRRSELCPDAADEGPQLDMRFKPTRQARDIVNQHHVLIPLLRFEKP